MNADELFGAEAGGVEVVGEVVETWLTGLTFFSMGLPCLSKNVSARVATSVDDIVSTCFPMISLIRDGIVFKRCSRRM